MGEIKNIANAYMNGEISYNHILQTYGAITLIAVKEMVNNLIIENENKYNLSIGSL